MPHAQMPHPNRRFDALDGRHQLSNRARHTRAGRRICINCGGWCSDEDEDEDDSEHELDARAVDRPRPPRMRSIDKCVSMLAPAAVPYIRPRSPCPVRDRSSLHRTGLFALISQSTVPHAHAQNASSDRRCHRRRQDPCVILGQPGRRIAVAWLSLSLAKRKSRALSTDAHQLGLGFVKSVDRNPWSPARTSTDRLTRHIPLQGSPESKSISSTFTFTFTSPRSPEMRDEPDTSLPPSFSVPLVSGAAEKPRRAPAPPHVHDEGLCSPYVPEATAPAGLISW
ncbi:hypothetical protein B0H15DRAFT_988584 [Mycena belliarum]|uniref:Uncharacterized protein n=1 Tax=Mycena belliarum TaxID=1033014 RepID=A0AAD6U420_9AGAR|nr:hypothetical protein B0H15DRAFT_988584 [Mycena belliae]